MTIRRIALTLAACAAPICAGMFAGCDSRPPPRKKAPPPPPAQTPVDEIRDMGITQAETGSIMFICASGKHEDKEIVIEACPACAQRRWFFQHPQRGIFVCYKCRADMPNEQIKCPDCGEAPRRAVRLKR